MRCRDRGCGARPGEGCGRDRAGQGCAGVGIPGRLGGLLQRRRGQLPPGRESGGVSGVRVSAGGVSGVQGSGLQGRGDRLQVQRFDAVVVGNVGDPARAERAGQAGPDAGGGFQDARRAVLVPQPVQGAVGLHRAGAAGTVRNNIAEVP